MNTYHQYKDEKLIAVDIESKDPFLTTKGPGVYRKDGKVIGVSFSNGELSEYYPLAHPGMDIETNAKNLRYIQDQLSSNNRKVFANGMYDLDWLINGEGISVNGTFEDVQIAEPLINEYRKSYSLNTLSGLYLNDEKKYDLPRQYAQQQGWPLSSKGGATQHLWRMPVDIVEGYAKEDARLTIQIFLQQEKILKEQFLEDVYRMEMNLFPLLLQMRRVGVRLDEKKLNSTGIEVADVKYSIQEELNDLAGFEINVNSAKELVRLFEKYSLPIVYGEPTDRMLDNGIMRGNPSFSKAVLSKVDNDVAKKILKLRHVTTLLNMFLVPYPDLLIDGRLHCQFNQLRSDEYGTVSGRFSSSNPNLQQVSGKDEGDYIDSSEDSELSGQVIRKLFIPEEGCDWLKGDWSQIEYRLIAHYAIGDGAETIRKRYNDDPSTDYHTELGIMTGLEDRKIVKTLNFGSAYGMGPEKMSMVYGWSLASAKQVYSMYHEKVPFVRETSRKVSNKAKRVGFIRTLLNRRARILDPKKAYVMFNRLIQGGAADIMKKAMADAHAAGVFNTLHPHLTVHDEMDVSMPRTKEGEEAGRELKRIMESCITLRVPIQAEFGKGPNWGELEKWE